MVISIKVCKALNLNESFLKVVVKKKHNFKWISSSIKTRPIEPSTAILYKLCNLIGRQRVDNRVTVRWKK